MLKQSVVLFSWIAIDTVLFNLFTTQNFLLFGKNTRFYIIPLKHHNIEKRENMQTYFRGDTI